MNCEVIHESERAGSMRGAARTRPRRRQSAKSGCQMVFISLEVQLFGVLSILAITPLAYVFLPVT